MYDGSMFAGCDESLEILNYIREENIKYIVEWALLQQWKTEAKTVISRKMQRN